MRLITLVAFSGAASGDQATGSGSVDVRPDAVLGAAIRIQEEPSDIPGKYLVYAVDDEIRTWARELFEQQFGLLADMKIRLPEEVGAAQSPHSIHDERIRQAHGIRPQTGLRLSCVKPCEARKQTGLKRLPQNQRSSHAAGSPATGRGKDEH